MVVSKRTDRQLQLNVIQNNKDALRVSLVTNGTHHFALTGYAFKRLAEDPMDDCGKVALEKDAVFFYL